MSLFFQKAGEFWVSRKRRPQTSKTQTLQRKKKRRTKGLKFIRLASKNWFCVCAMSVFYRSLFARSAFSRSAFSRSALSRSVFLSSVVCVHRDKEQTFRYETLKLILAVKHFSPLSFLKHKSKAVVYHVSHNKYYYYNNTIIYAQYLFWHNYSIGSLFISA